MPKLVWKWRVCDSALVWDLLWSSAGPTAEVCPCPHDDYTTVYMWIYTVHADSKWSISMIWFLSIFPLAVISILEGLWISVWLCVESGEGGWGWGTGGLFIFFFFFCFVCFHWAWPRWSVFNLSEGRVVEPRYSMHLKVGAHERGHRLPADFKEALFLFFFFMCLLSTQPVWGADLLRPMGFGHSKGRADQRRGLNHPKKLKDWGKVGVGVGGLQAAELNFNGCQL